ncbi:uncharacterized protein LOC142803920 isoform X1 [Rhipicephalus microplus]|uniref:uncharacterized protein LOC142803920 isoform X1 n=1 Tax=Rhipicephalus microplus TaxID=6941 RepID=UPI003F6CAA80
MRFVCSSISRRHTGGGAGYVFMLGTPSRTRHSNPESLPPVETPVHRSSRRLQGVAPELNSFPETASNRLPPSTIMATAATSHMTLQNPMIPDCFHGETHEDAQDWLDQFERCAKYNQWTTPEDKLTNVYYLKDNAQTWYINRERSMATWDGFRNQLIDTFSSLDRKENAQRLLEARIRKPNESVAMFAEDMTRLFGRADPEMPEDRKLRYLMRGMKEQLFAGLVRNPPTTVAEFTKEGTAIERALQQRYRQQSPVNVRASSPVTTAASLCDNDRPLWEVIREISREELRQLGLIPATEPTPALSFVTDVVRDEVRQALSSSGYNGVQRHFTYADAVRRPVVAPSAQQTPMTGPPPTLQTQPLLPLKTFPTTPISPTRRMPFSQNVKPTTWFNSESPFTYQRRKTDLWCTADRRPVCFHCGEAGHVYRVCRYRDAQYSVFSRYHDYATYDGRRTNNDTPMNTPPNNPMRPGSCSPSPAQGTSPNHRSFADVTRSRSPSPRQGN